MSNGNAAREERHVYSDGVGRELVYPGAFMTRDKALRYGERHIPRDLKRAGFKAHVFTSDIEIHGALYYRITYGRDC